MFIDIGIIVIVLIGFIIGIVRGAGKSFIKLLSIVGALVLTWRLTPYVLRFVFDGQEEGFANIFYQLIFGDGVSLVKDSVILQAVCNPLSNYVNSIHNPALTVEQYMPYLLAAFSATIIISLIVYLVVRLLVMIIASILKGIFIKYEPTKFSRFVGGLLGIVNSVFVVCIIYILSASVVGIPALSQPIAEQAQDSFAVKYSYTLVVENYSQFMVEEDHLSEDPLYEARIAAEKAAGLR